MDRSSTLQIAVTRGLTINGELIGPINNPAIVMYYTKGLTADGNRDFSVNNGSLSFAPGATRAILNVEILSDNLPEVEESFKIVMYETVGDVVLKDPIETVVIVNASDDPHGIIGFQVR